MIRISETVIDEERRLQALADDIFLRRNVGDICEFSYDCKSLSERPFPATGILFAGDLCTYVYCRRCPEYQDRKGLIVNTQE